MSKLKAVILAAGQGTRMKSKMPKVIHKVLDKSMVEYAISAAREAGADEICIVVGHGADQVKAAINEDVTFVTQDKQLGTGHAVKCAKNFIGLEGQTLILFGDTPLITGSTLNNLVKHHRENNNGVTVLSTVVEDSTGYGRIVRDANGNFVKSVEHKDATKSEREIKEINSGMYVYDSALLFETLDLINNNNAQGEYYLPDTLTIIKNMGERNVDAMITEDFEEIMGVNSRRQLADATKVIQKRVNGKWMDEGVTIINPELTFISVDAVIERDVTIYPNTFIYGNTRVKEDEVLLPGTMLGMDK